MNLFAKSREILLASTVLALALVGFPPNAWSQQGPWGDVKIVQAPADFSYIVEEVYFKRPHHYKIVASKIEKALVAVKVTIYGRGFKEQATGPVVWLNRIPAHFVRISPDGDVAEAYFYRPFQDIEKGPRELRGWELVYLPHEGGGEGYRIGPKGRRGERPRDLSAMPPVRRLTEVEWQHAKELSEQYQVPLPPRPPR